MRQSHEMSHPDGAKDYPVLTSWLYEREEAWLSLQVVGTE